MSERGVDNVKVHLLFLLDLRFCTTILSVHRFPSF